MHKRAKQVGPALLLLAALASPPADALVRCVGKDGKVTYTDGECDEGQKASGVAIHDSSGMVSPKGGASSKSSSKATTRSMIPSAQSGIANLPPPPKMDYKPVPVPPHLNDPNVNAGVRQHAKHQYDEARKAQEAENKQKMDQWKEDVKRASESQKGK